MVVWGADWKPYGLSDSGLFFFDAKGITRPSKDIVRVWEKLVYTEKKISEIIEKFGREYENFHHAIMLNEINCKNRTYRQLQITHYTKGGKVIWSGDFYDARLDFIPPESVVEELYEIVCK